MSQTHLRERIQTNASPDIKNEIEVFVNNAVHRTMGEMFAGVKAFLLDRKEADEIVAEIRRDLEELITKPNSQTGTPSP